MEMRRIFWGFCRNWFLMSSLHYLSGRSDFGFEFAGRIGKTTPRYHLYGESPTIRVIRGVADSAYQWCGESSTPRLNDTGSRRLPVSPIRRVGYWILLKKTLCIDDTESRQLPAPVILWVADSPYPWIGESPTPRITDTESRRLRVSLSRGVDDSAYRWYGESLFEKKFV